MPVPSALRAQKGLGAEEQEGRRSKRMKEKEEGEARDRRREET